MRGFESPPSKGPPHSCGFQRSTPIQQPAGLLPSNGPPPDNTQFKRERHPCPRRDSNPQSQQEIALDRLVMQVLQYRH